MTDLKIRLSGPVDCSIATNPSLPVHKVHVLADEVERVIKSKHAHTDSVFVHVEPSAKTVLSAIIPVKEMWHRLLFTRLEGSWGWEDEVKADMIADSNSVFGIFRKVTNRSCKKCAGRHWFRDNRRYHSTCSGSFFSRQDNGKILNSLRNQPVCLLR